MHRIVIQNPARERASTKISSKGSRVARKVSYRPMRQEARSRIINIRFSVAERSFLNECTKHERITVSDLIVQAARAAARPEELRRVVTAPRVRGAVSRKHLIPVRLTPAEYDDIEAAAHLAQRRVSRWIRWVVLKSIGHEPIEEQAACYKVPTR